MIGNKTKFSFDFRLKKAYKTSVQENYNSAEDKIGYSSSIAKNFIIRIVWIMRIKNLTIRQARNIQKN